MSAGRARGGRPTRLGTARFNARCAASAPGVLLRWGCRVGLHNGAGSEATVKLTNSTVTGNERDIQVLLEVYKPGNIHFPMCVEAQRVVIPFHGQNRGG